MKNTEPGPEAVDARRPLPGQAFSRKKDKQEDQCHDEGQVHNTIDADVVTVFIDRIA
jgi:hypothetical protein